MRLFRLHLIAIVCFSTFAPCASASNVLVSKALQRVTIAPAASVWKVTEDAPSTTPEIANYTLAHRALDGLINVSITEMRNSPFELTLEKYWIEYKSDMRSKFKVFREVALPKLFRTPRGFGCNADESAMINTAPLSITITCSAAKQKDQVTVTITLPHFVDTTQYMADLNGLLETLAWK
jgi:hypothetical protein